VSHVLVQLCDEVGWFHWEFGSMQQLAGDFQWFSVHEVS
jgi:hypothetical protein